MFGLQPVPSGYFNNIQLLNYVLEKISLFRPIVFLLIILLLTAFQWVSSIRPQIKYHSLFVFICALVGCLNGTKNSKHPNNILDISWPQHQEIDPLWKALKESLGNNLQFLSIIYQPYFMVNTVAIGLITFLESHLSMKIAEESIGSTI